MTFVIGMICLLPVSGFLTYKVIMQGRTIDDQARKNQEKDEIISKLKYHIAHGQKRKT